VLDFRPAPPDYGGPNRAQNITPGGIYKFQWVWAATTELEPDERTLVGYRIKHQHLEGHFAARMLPSLALTGDEDDAGINAATVEAALVPLRYSRWEIIAHILDRPHNLLLFKLAQRYAADQSKGRTP
jgi:hypothetical protein